MSEEDNVTRLRLLEGYKFNVEFDTENIPDLIVDETGPIGSGDGPNPVRLLAAAVGHCTSSSLIYCLHKARIEIKNLETIVKTKVARNKEGRWRVAGIDVQLLLKTDQKDKKRVPICLMIFEDYCNVTQSLRKGIQVNMQVTRTS